MDTGYAVKIERGNGNIILRHFILTKRYDASDVKENNFEWNERYRSVVSKGDVKDYIYRYSVAMSEWGGISGLSISFLLLLLSLKFYYK